MTGARLVWGCAIVATTLSWGCRGERQPNPYRPGGHFAKQVDAKGRRVVVSDAAARTHFKMRKRPGRYKVYDARLGAAGWVHWARREGVLTMSVAPVGRALSPLKREARVELEYPGALRVERSGEGSWLVFGSEARLLAELKRNADGSWQLVERVGEARRWRARRDEGVSVARSGKVLRRSAQLGPAAVLATTLEGLAPLPRAALAVWCEHGLER